MAIVSIYSGAGGIDYGFEAAGLDTRVCVEMDPTCCQTIRENRDHWAVIVGDIHNVSTQEILLKGGFETGDQVDVLIGGPPCQPFSKAGQWATGDIKRLSDPRASTLEEYLRVLREIKPTVFLLENVPDIVVGEKKEVLEMFEEKLNEINTLEGTNYEWRYAILNAADFGAPQNRRRFFMIGSIDGTAFSFPEPTHGTGQAGLFDINLEPYRNAWDAFYDLPEETNLDELQMQGRWAGLLPSVPPGENYLYHTNRGNGQPIFGWRTRYWSFLQKLSPTLPSWTIQAQPGPAIGPFHWDNRMLSARELARLQTFPDDVVFNCERRQYQKMLGNAVPSLLAEILAREIRVQLLQHDPEDLPPGPQLLRPAANIPAPEIEIQPVPQEYMNLVGHHEDHPGTGLGPGARRRNQATAL